MKIKSLTKKHERFSYYYDINSDGVGNIYFPEVTINKTIEEINEIIKEEKSTELFTVKEVLRIALKMATSGVINIRKEVVETLMNCLDKAINEITMEKLKNKINTPEGENAIDKADILSDMVLFHRYVRKNAEE